MRVLDVPRAIFRVLKHPDVVGVTATLGAVVSVWSAVFAPSPEMVELEPNVRQYGQSITGDVGSYLFQAEFLNASSHQIRIEEAVIEALTDDGNAIHSLI